MGTLGPESQAINGLKATPVHWAYWKTVVASTAVGRGIIQVDRSAFLPMLPAMAVAMGLSGAQAGSIASAYALFYVGLMVPAGALGDRFGLKRLVVLSYFLTATALLAAGLVARSYPAILVSLALHGLGAGAYFPSAYAMLLREAPGPKRGLSMGVVFTGTSLGTGLGFVVAGIAFGLTGQWWAAMALLTVPTFLTALSCQLVLKEVPTGASRF
ncbi:MAG: MFS transporter [Chloroflexi bacterium]|nr:MFS transporter [Chloroflexota bacterium]